MNSEAYNQKPIVILGPMESESAWLIDRLSHQTAHSIGAYIFHEGKIDGYPVVICRCYIGVVNSAAAATLAIQHYNPLCVIIQGTSGAHDPDLHQGDIILGETIVHLGRFFTPHCDKGNGSDPFRWAPQGSEIVSVDPDQFTSILHSDSQYSRDRPLLRRTCDARNNRRGGHLEQGAGHDSASASNPWI